MALDVDAVFGLALATAASVGAPTPAAVAQWTLVAAAINAQIKKADLVPGTVLVPITGPAGSTPATGSGVLQ